MANSPEGSCADNEGVAKRRCHRRSVGARYPKRLSGKTMTDMSDLVHSAERPPAAVVTLDLRSDQVDFGSRHCIAGKDGQYSA